jgi:hypothetical protein
MNSRFFGALLVVSLADPISANAQVTTLDYTGAEMTGTETNYVAATQSYVTTSFTDEIVAQIVLNGSIAQGDLTMVSYELGYTVHLMNNDGWADPLSGAFTGLSLCNNGNSSQVFGCINLTAVGNTITGAVVNISTGAAQENDVFYNIGLTGDSLTLAPSLQGFDPRGDYFMGAQVSNTTPGTWSVTTSAPEMSPGVAPSGIALIIGSLMVLRGRRETKRRDLSDAPEMW